MNIHYFCRVAGTVWVCVLWPLLSLAQTTPYDDSLADLHEDFSKYRMMFKLSDKQEMEVIVQELLQQERKCGYWGGSYQEGIIREKVKAYWAAQRGVHLDQRSIDMDVSHRCQNGTNQSILGLLDKIPKQSGLEKKNAQRAEYEKYIDQSEHLNRVRRNYIQLKRERDRAMVKAWEEQQRAAAAAEERRKSFNRWIELQPIPIPVRVVP
jgi:hypothetical protein